MMAKEKKGLNTKIYAVIVFFLMAGFLAGVTVVAYTNKYNGFSSEKVALAYVESIVNRGDGYNAYKNALPSKNFKYGDFIREYYMYPVIYRDTDYKPLDNRDGLKGFNDDSFKGEKTLNDTGALAGQVINEMYPYYESLIKSQGGWDNYDYIFTSYFSKLVEVRKEIFGDDYMTDEIMFTALESNVSTYGDRLTGTDNEIDENTGVQLSEKTVGVYEKTYGEDYKITCEIVATEQSSYHKGEILGDDSAYSVYKISNADVSDAVSYKIAVKANGKTVVDGVTVSLIKINSTWYVDNTKTDTSALYKIQK